MEQKGGTAMTGAERIAADVQRQIESEGWDSPHDAEHTDGSLVLAAISYAANKDETLDLCAERIVLERRRGKSIIYMDPWPESWSKQFDKRIKHDRIRTAAFARKCYGCAVQQTRGC